MQLPPKTDKDFKPTQWEMSMSYATGKPPSFFRVPHNAAVLTPEQQAVMRDMVSANSRARKLFTKGAKGK